jgi:hypothetical protein
MFRSGVGGRPKHPSFAGILLQEYDPAAKKLVGPVKNVFAGSPHGLVEGPHLFKRDGWYYLTTAEGGTGYDHAVTMARSRSIDGPYELHPDVHVITSKDAPDATLQRAGHGQIVETPDGAVYHTHLCSRPLPGCGARRSGARPRSRNASGATTAGCGWKAARRCRRSRWKRPPALSHCLRRRQARAIPFRAGPRCRSTSSGSGRPIRRGCSRSPNGPARCVSSAANRSAPGSTRRWWRAARSIFPSAPRPNSISRRSTSSRPPASPTITTVTSSTFVGVKGPGIFLAQFAATPRRSTRFRRSRNGRPTLGYKGVQIPTWDARLFDLKKAATSKPIATR